MLYELDLNEEQRVAVQSTIATAESDMNKLQNQIDANNIKLWRVQPDDPNYSNVVAEIGQANGTLVSQIATERGNTRAQVNTLLTANQKVQLDSMIEAMLSNPHRGERESASMSVRDAASLLTVTAFGPSCSRALLTALRASGN